MQRACDLASQARCALSVRLGEGAALLAHQQSSRSLLPTQHA